MISLQLCVLYESNYIKNILLSNESKCEPYFQATQKVQKFFFIFPKKKIFLNLPDVKIGFIWKRIKRWTIPENFRSIGVKLFKLLTKTYLLRNNISRDPLKLHVVYLENGWWWQKNFLCVYLHKWVLPIYKISGKLEDPPSDTFLIFFWFLGALPLKISWILITMTVSSLFLALSYGFYDFYSLFTQSPFSGQPHENINGFLQKSDVLSFFLKLN